AQSVRPDDQGRNRPHSSRARRDLRREGPPLSGAMIQGPAMASPKTRRTTSAKKLAAPNTRSKQPAIRFKHAKTPKKKGDVQQAGVAKKPARRKGTGFGRVKVPVDARLDLVFQKDYQAREVFDFLKVQTIRELEEYGPDEILDRLTGPMQQTVLRIRK